MRDATLSLLPPPWPSKELCDIKMRQSIQWYKCYQEPNGEAGNKRKQVWSINRVELLLRGDDGCQNMVPSTTSRLLGCTETQDDKKKMFIQRKTIIVHIHISRERI